MRWRGPAVLGNRNFSLYWAGVVLSEIGVRGTLAVNLYHVYALTNSTALVGLIGLFQGVALVILSPLGGAFADRVDRRRLLQLTQSLSLGASLALAVLTYAGVILPWHIYVAVVLNTAATTFDHPTRQALIPAFVPREQLVQAFALLNPSRELAILIGPALGGLLLALGGPVLMYSVDAGSYALLVVVLAFLRTPRTNRPAEPPRLWTSIREGAAYLRGQPIVLRLTALDLSASLFGAWRVILPALATDILGVGEVAYGLLASAPSAGALLSAPLVYKLVTFGRSGAVVLLATAGYGIAVIALANAPVLGLALAAGLAIGATDSLVTSVRHAAVQLETPDALRGRVTALVQVASRGGPALGDANVGWISALAGPAAALSIGGLVPIGSALAYTIGSEQMRRYRLPGAR